MHPLHITRMLYYQRVEVVPSVVQVLYLRYISQERDHMYAAGTIFRDLALFKAISCRNENTTCRNNALNNNGNSLTTRFGIFSGIFI